ncbi:MAG TPA: septum formation initiator family protein [Candidatus Paceibacterota bacterium]|nr:septum formation initiator family protein [Candidatus Paceibacterota bacterium]
MPAIFHKKYLTPILVLVALWLGYSVYQMRDDRAQIGLQVTDLESKITDIQQDNQTIASSSAYLTSDAYLERQARLQLNYKLPDEQVAYVYEDKGTSTLSVDQAYDHAVGRLPTWKKWLYYLIGKRD